MYSATVLVQGFPGRSPTHGGFGWSTALLLRGGGRNVIVDGGGLGARAVLLKNLARCGVRPEDVDTVFVSHAHWDHAVNWVLFPNARVLFGREELEWALGLPIVQADVAEAYIRLLRDCPRLCLIEAGEEALPGVSALPLPGHTPGQLGLLIDNGASDLIYGADAAKFRGELVSRNVGMTLDERASAQSIERLWSLWSRKPGSVLFIGHDAPLLLEHGRAVYAASRQVRIEAFFGDDCRASDILTCEEENKVE